MKFSNILCAVFGLSAFVAALPAPVPVADTNLDLLEKRELIEREPLGALEPRGGTCRDLVIEVKACIDGVKKANEKYNAQGVFNKDSCHNWSIEIVALLKLLVDVIISWPSGCPFPPIDVCVNIFVDLFVVIFVQLKVFVNLGGLLGILLLTVNLLLNLLLGVCGDLITVFVQLCLLIEAKIKVGICALIIKGCGGLLPPIWINLIISLCARVGIVIIL